MICSLLRMGEDGEMGLKHKSINLFFILISMTIICGCFGKEIQKREEPSSVYINVVIDNDGIVDNEDIDPTSQLLQQEKGWMINDANELIIQTQSGMDGFAALLMEGREIDELGFCFEKEEKSIQTEYRRAILTVSILDGVQYVPDYTFMGFEALEQCSIAEGIKTIGRSAFRDCESLKKCELPDTVDGIGAEAFSGCSALQRFHIPTSVTELKYGTLCECENLRELIIPENVKIIREDAISFSGMKRIVFMGTVEYIEGIYALPELMQYVFLQGPPIKNGETDSNSYDDGKIGLSREATNCPIYYLNKNAELWAPNGETEWNGFPLVGIDSLDDLPPLTETTSAIVPPADGERTPAVEEINGNLQHGGCAVKAEGMIYALDYYENETVPVIVRYDPQTGIKSNVIELHSSNRTYFSPYLSYANGGIFYKDKIDSECIIRYDIQTGEQEIMAEPYMFEWFVAVNDKLFLSTMQGEMWIRENGADKVFLQGPEDPEGFYNVPLGIMEGLFYALCYEEDVPYIAVFDLDGNRLDRIDLPYRMTMSDYLDQVIPYGGKLYCLVHNVEQGLFTLDVYDATEKRVVSTTKLDSLHMNSMSMNISDGRVYLSGDGVYELNELGETKLISKEQCVAVTLIDGEPVERYVHCDEPHR